jgi:hypothetical protein
MMTVGCAVRAGRRGRGRPRVSGDRCCSEISVALRGGWGQLVNEHIRAGLAERGEIERGGVANGKLGEPSFPKATRSYLSWSVRTGTEEDEEASTSQHSPDEMLAKTPSAACRGVLIVVTEAWSLVTLLSIQYLCIPQKTSCRKEDKATFGLYCQQIKRAVHRRSMSVERERRGRNVEATKNEIAMIIIASASWYKT